MTLEDVCNELADALMKAPSSQAELLTHRHFHGRLRALLALGEAVHTLARGPGGDWQRFEALREQVKDADRGSLRAKGG